MNYFATTTVLETMKSMSIKSAVLASGLAVLSLSLWAAAPADISKLPPPASALGVTFDKDIKPILEKSCVKCHGAEKPKGKYRLDSRAAAIKGGSSDEAAVVPGKSEKSPMVLFPADLVEEMEMPPKDKRDKYPGLTKDQIALVRAWIDQGAK